jgi:hypothetical protein
VVSITDCISSLIDDGLIVSLRLDQISESFATS